mmetsp:Transcript_54356/g.62271  ORF Transcript_54356/g.62271 Transcript_54356/m.62271 type:complete len:510 (-) Transcript_54356:535-2064(-)
MIALSYLNYAILCTIFVLCTQKSVVYGTELDTLLLNNGSSELYQSTRWRYFAINIPEEFPHGKNEAHLKIQLDVKFTPVRAPIEGYGTATPIVSLSTSDLFPEEDPHSSTGYIYANYVDYESYFASDKVHRIDTVLEGRHKGNQFILGVANLNSAISSQFYYNLRAEISAVKSCPNNCTSREAGICIEDGQCLCFRPWIGEDCSIKAIEFKPDAVHNFYLLPYHTEYAILSVRSADTQQNLKIAADSSQASDLDGSVVQTPVIGHILKDTNQKYDAIPSERLNDQKFEISTQNSLEYSAQLFKGKTWILALRYEPKTIDTSPTVMRVVVEVSTPEEESPSIPLLYIIFIAFFVVFLLGLVTISGIKACNRDPIADNNEEIEVPITSGEVSFTMTAELAKTLFPAIAFDHVKTKLIDNCCSICLEDYVDESNLRVLGCQHAFHQVCIDNWFERNSKCPLCKRSIENLSKMVTDTTTATLNRSRADLATALPLPNTVSNEAHIEIADIESG